MNSGRRRLLASALGILLAATGSWAGDKDSKKKDRDEKESKEPSIEGNVSRLDEAARSFTLRDDDEKEVTFHWTSATRLLDAKGRATEPESIRIGARVKVRYAEQSGKRHAVEVKLQD